MRDSVGSAAIAAASCRNRRRESLMAFPSRGSPADGISAALENGGFGRSAGSSVTRLHHVGARGEVPIASGAVDVAGGGTWPSLPRSTSCAGIADGGDGSRFARTRWFVQPIYWAYRGVSLSHPLVPLSQKVAGRVPSESDIGRDSHQLMRAEMGLPRAECSESRFAKYVVGIASVIGHADRVRPLWDYCVGLMMPCERKSVEPIAALTAPKRVGAQHQSLLHFVNQAPWSDEKVSAKVCEMVRPER